MSIVLLKHLCFQTLPTLRVSHTSLLLNATCHLTPHRTDVLNWLERLGARQVAIDLQDSSLPQIDICQLSARSPDVQVMRSCLGIPSSSGSCCQIQSMTLSDLPRCRRASEGGGHCRSLRRPTIVAQAGLHTHMPQQAGTTLHTACQPLPELW